jgi:hypothetical protein
MRKRLSKVEQDRFCLSQDPTIILNESRHFSGWIHSEEFRFTGFATLHSTKFKGFTNPFQNNVGGAREQAPGI